MAEEEREALVAAVVKELGHTDVQLSQQDIDRLLRGVATGEIDASQSVIESVVESGVEKPAEEGDDGQDGDFHRMPGHGLRLGEAFRTGSAQKIALQHVQEAVAHQTGDVRNIGRGETDRRQDHLAHRSPSTDRQPAEPQRKRSDQERSADRRRVT